MKMKKRIVIPALAMTVATVIGGTVYATKISAQNMDPEYHQEVISVLAEKLNVDETKVDQVLKEIKQAKQAEKEAEFRDRLIEAVKAGNLTQSQMEAVLTKHDELKEIHESIWEIEDREERKKELRLVRDEMNDWFDKQGIDKKLFRFRGLKGRGKKYL